MKSLRIITIIALLLGFTAMSRAQTDITAFMPVAQLAGSSSNTAAGTGVIGWNIDQISVISCSIVMTNTPHITTLSNAVIRFDTSLNGTDWVTNSHSFSVVPQTQGTNAYTTIARLTNSTGAQWLRIGAVENVNTNRVYFSRLTWKNKE